MTTDPLLYGLELLCGRDAPSLPKESSVTPAKTAVEACSHSIARGGVVFICGNGGSAAMASHFAAELVVRYEKNRRALPCINLAADVGLISACANDLGYASVFARQLHALGRAGDMLITLSTSGKSENVIEAAAYADRIAMGILDPGPRVGEESTAQCQERHLKWLHEVAKGLEDWGLLHTRK